ncbi:MAG: Endonuclease/exonuclease/phosphatase, partial [Linnemannia elongata]
HTNTTMPDPLVLPKTPDGCVKITSWNVSGLNSSLKKGFKTYITAEDADVICIQEHKVQQPLLNLVDPKVYPFSWWGFEEKKGYAGVAMFCKTKPINVTAGLPTHPNPACTKGRIVTLEYPTCFILGCYVPNAGQGLVRLKERMVWDKAMKAWLLDLKSKGKQIIWTGDLNVCHLPIDLRNPGSNTASAGFTPEERAGFSAILKEGDLVDTFREIQGTGEEAVGQYSYFSYRFQCRVKGIGWRLDYFVTDQQMYKERLVESVIREECYGASDHVPVVLVIKGEL